MQSDWITKLLLVVIAAGLWALVATGGGLPLDSAYAGGGLKPDRRDTGEAGASVMRAPRQPDEGGFLGKPASSPRAPSATLPLRWKVSWATERSTDTTFCGTAVLVTNETSSSVSVEVEWFDKDGSALALKPLSVSSMQQRNFISGTGYLVPDTDYRPFDADEAAMLADIEGGYARVHASDPRILVAAFQYCRDGQGNNKNIVSITQIPVYPVGATLEFYQAGVPGMWSPPMAGPEVPDKPR